VQECQSQAWCGDIVHGEVIRRSRDAGMYAESRRIDVQCLFKCEVRSMVKTLACVVFLFRTKLFQKHFLQLVKKFAVH